MQPSPPLSDTFVAASSVVARVLAGASLADGLVRVSPPAQETCYGTLRDYGVLDGILEQLLRQPLTDRDVHALLLCAVRELRREQRAAYAIVNEAVRACVALGFPAAKGLVNGVLRNYLRNRDAIDAQALAREPARYRHPQWWIDRLKRAYPSDWTSILAAGNEHPPMTLRVNRRRSDPDAYLARLATADIAARRLEGVAVQLDEPRPVSALPGFDEGVVSVQDAGAQLAAQLIDVRDGQRVLDACAAPGGKTGHLAETADIELTALDDDADRAARIGENLQRLGLAARVIVADASEPASWWDGTPFDRVLLDAPCTASGVVRRHPDIKWLRREADIARFAQQQARLLDALWRVVAPGGKLLYATCSMFPEENVARIEAFLEHHRDAVRLATPPVAAGQLLPDHEHDGFFYALLHKR